MPFITLYDTDVLFPNAQRDLLIRIGMSNLVQAKWTEKIINDLGRALGRAYPEMPEARLERLKVLIYESVPDCLVSDYEPLIDSLKLPDPDDRHVLAAAIKAGAQVIVTNNLRHFPADDLSPWNIEARAADDFVLDQIHINDKVVFACVRQIVDSRHRHRSLCATCWRNWRTLGLSSQSPPSGPANDAGISKPARQYRWGVPHARP